MTRSRRGSQAIEFALTLPVLLLLAGGVMDLGQYLLLADGLSDAVSQGALSGAMADEDRGEDPIAVARDEANGAWIATGLPGAPTFTAAFEGAAPDRKLLLTAEVPFEGWFGFVDLPDTITSASVVRTMDQPD